MRIAILSAAMIATLVGAVPAVAQDARWQGSREYRERGPDTRRDYRRDVRDVRNAQYDRRDIRRDQGRFGGRDWHDFRRYDYNRFEPGQRTYFADRYYRDGRYYQPRQLGRNDRIYRGGNGGYYCRRNDGTTGLVVGGLAGGVLGSVIANGGSSLLGALIGGGGGALLGQSIDRGNVRCR